jgi:hypothetical protein
LLSATVGVEPVLQHTPRAVTGSPPAEMTVPPHCALVSVTELTAAVATTGTLRSSGAVISSFPLHPALDTSAHAAINDTATCPIRLRMVNPPWF